MSTEEQQPFGDLYADTKRALLERIKRGAENPNSDAANVRDIAEAFAWITSTNQPH